MRNRPNTITVVFFAPAGCYNIKNLILTLYCAPKAQKNEDSQGEIASKLLKKRVLLGGKQFDNYNNCFELHIIIESITHDFASLDSGALKEGGDKTKRGDKTSGFPLIGIFFRFSVRLGCFSHKPHQ